MIIRGDARRIPLADRVVQTCVTSPPYWGLRDYGIEGQIGLEPTPEAYVATMVQVFREVWRVLRDDGTLWLNLGDSYVHGVPGGGSVFAGGRNGSDGRKSYESDKPRGREKIATLAPALRHRIRLGPDNIAAQIPAVGLESKGDAPRNAAVTDRPTRSHEYLFLLAKSERYFYDADAIREIASEGSDLGLLRGRNAGPNDMVAWHAPSILKRQLNGVDSRSAGSRYRNKRDVWMINSEPTPEAHFATFPQRLVEPCILAGSRVGDVVLDPFLGSGTVGKVAERLGRRWIGMELSSEYIDIAEKRTAQRGLMLG